METIEHIQAVRADRRKTVATIQQAEQLAKGRHDDLCSTNVNTPMELEEIESQALALVHQLQDTPLPKR